MDRRQAKTGPGEYNRIGSSFLNLRYSEHIINLAINGFEAMFAEISHILNKIRKYSHFYYMRCKKVVETG